MIGLQDFSLFCTIILAERMGFEPMLPFWGKHAFQACLLNHSSISPGSINKAANIGKFPEWKIL